jgi:hypothetical protein
MTAHVSQVKGCFLTSLCFFDSIQDWTGEELTQCSLYGVRIYYEGSVLVRCLSKCDILSRLFYLPLRFHQ